MTTFTKPIFTIYPDLEAWFIGAHFRTERFETMSTKYTNYHVMICIIPCLVFHIGWTKYLARD